MPCTVKKTLEKVVQSGNHYLVKVKNNQRRLKAAVEETVMCSEPAGYYREEAIKRGRLEIRETYLYRRQENLDPGWESVRLIAYVRRDFLSAKKNHKTDSLYVSDLQTDDAEAVAKGIRSHWYIENKLHWVKDAVMREDERSTGNKTAAANLALLRDIAFNILKTKNKSVKQATEAFANYTVGKVLRLLFRT